MISYDQWQGWFTGAEPIDFVLRDVLRGRWVRFHSLPSGQRYPADESDFATLLQRHNAVMSTLVGSGDQVMLLTSGYSDTETPEGQECFVESFAPHAVHWHTVNMELICPKWFSGYRHLYASEHSWQPRLFDPLIRLAAKQRHAGVLLLDPGCRWAIAPYDGGMDVIAESWVARDRLKAQFRDWLPESSAGL